VGQCKSEILNIPRYLLKELESNNCTMFTKELNKPVFAGASKHHNIDILVTVGNSNIKMHDLITEIYASNLQRCC